MQQDPNTLRRELGEIFHVQVTPRSTANQVIVDRDERGALRLRVKVTAAPEKGKANVQVIRTLSKFLGLPKSSIAIVGGLSARRKTIRILCSS